MLGLVDAHTHPVWAGDRVHEFAMKVSKTSEYHVIKQQRIHNFWQKIRCLITAKNAIYRIHEMMAGLNPSLSKTFFKSYFHLSKIKFNDNHIVAIIWNI